MISLVNKLIARPAKWLYSKAADHPVAAGAAALAADGLTKYAATDLKAERLSRNYGAANGVPAIYTNFDHAVTFTCLTSLALLFSRAKTRISKLAIALLTAGSAGNTLERAHHGFVTDFIVTSPLPRIYNLADVSFAASLGLLGADLLAGPRDKSVPRKPWRQIVKGSFTVNKWNTVGQTALYGLAGYLTFGIAAAVPLVIAPLAFSLIRDIRHNGERTF
ncbi:MAG TPA: signal peptidase II [Candidatus Sulfotelmatobacter sp.]|nr:signal peptidase II [Candidatus Sulfotelmatobacter sp.]